MLFFKQILNGAAEDFGYSIQRLGTCFVDILVSLLVHLDRSEADTGTLGEFCLRDAICSPDPLQIGFGEVFLHQLICSIHKFGDISFMERIVHLLHILEGDRFEEIAVLSSGMPLVISSGPANPVFSGAAHMFVGFGRQRFAHCFGYDFQNNLDTAFAGNIGRLSVFHPLAD